MIIIKLIFFVISLVSTLILLGLCGEELMVATKPSGYWLTPLPYLIGFVVVCTCLVQSIVLLRG